MSDIKFTYNNNENTFYIHNFIEGITKISLGEAVETLLEYSNGKKLVAALALEALTNRANNKKPMPSPAQRSVDSLLKNGPYVLGSPLAEMISTYPELEHIEVSYEEDDEDDDGPGDVLAHR